MLSFLCETNTWNWNDFWQTVLGALLGFLFAIFSSVIFGIISRKAECVFIKNSVRVEFESILNAFDRINFDSQFIESISVAYWDSLVSGNKFSYMKIKNLNEQIYVRNTQKLEASMALNDDRRNIATAVFEQIDNNIEYNCKVTNTNSIASDINDILKLISRKKKGRESNG